MKYPYKVEQVELLWNRMEEQVTAIKCQFILY